MPIDNWRTYSEKVEDDRARRLRIAQLEAEREERQRREAEQLARRVEAFEKRRAAYVDDASKEYMIRNDPELRRINLQSRVALGMLIGQKAAEAEAAERRRREAEEREAGIRQRREADALAAAARIVPGRRTELGRAIFASYIKDHPVTDEINCLEDFMAKLRRDKIMREREREATLQRFGDAIASRERDEKRLRELREEMDARLAEEREVLRERMQKEVFDRLYAERRAGYEEMKQGLETRARLQSEQREADIGQRRADERRIAEQDALDVGRAAARTRDERELILSQLGQKQPEEQRQAWEDYSSPFVEHAYDHARRELIQEYVEQILRVLPDISDEDLEIMPPEVAFETMVEKRYRRFVAEGVDPETAERKARMEVAGLGRREPKPGQRPPTNYPW